MYHITLSFALLSVVDSYQLHVCEGLVSTQFCSGRRHGIILVSSGLRVHFVMDNSERESNSAEGTHTAYDVIPRQNHSFEGACSPRLAMTLGFRVSGVLNSMRLYCTRSCGEYRRSNSPA